MNTLSFCVSTFRVDYEMYSLSIWKFPYEKYLCLEEDEQLGFIQDKHYDLSVAFEMKECLCTFHIDHDMFCFLMARMTGAGWCYRSGTLSTLFGNTP